jgi:hypothetical protein
MNAGEKVKLIDADPDTVGRYGLCGYKDPSHPGFQGKLAWFKARFREGMRIKVLHDEERGAVGSIEYLPGEYAWRAVRAPGYLVVHCLFIQKKDYKGKGYGSQLLRACEKDALAGQKHGVAAVTSRSTWMAKDGLFLKNGYACVEEAPPHYQLMVKKYRDDGPLPAFSGDWKKKCARYGKGLTIIYADQCPYVIKAMTEIPAAAREDFGIEPVLVKLKNCRSARNAPNPYGVFSILWEGELVADHPVSPTRFRNIMNKRLKNR